MSEFKLFGVLGYPVLHSKSPQMQNAALKAVKVEGIYTRIATFSAEETLRIAKEMGLRGFNVTAPFKGDIAAIVEDKESHAQKIGAVNAVVMGNRGPKGYNTDYLGVVGALRVAGAFKQKNEKNPKPRKAVVLGAGGAAMAAVYGLIDAGCSVMVINRTGGKAEVLARMFKCGFGGLDRLDKELADADILVSALSMSAPTVVKQEYLRPAMFVMDANYDSSELLIVAKGAGCRFVNGIEWLVHQAAPAFELFTGKSAPLEVFRNAALSAKCERKPNIALIGFMSAGKSTIGKIVAELRGMEFVDLDKAIAREAGMPISRIFETKGEDAFREMECEMIEREIKGARGKVFALGGGAVLSAENRRLIQENCTAVWLWIAPELAVERAGESRPLLKGENKLEKAKELLKQRLQLYAETCDMVINSGANKDEKVAKRISYEIDYAFGN